MPGPSHEPARARRRRWLFRSLVLLAATILALAGGELLLRAVGYYYTPFVIASGSRIRDWRFKHLFQDACFEYDADRIWRPRPDTSVFNSQGFRGPVLPKEKAPGEIRIFAVGDSNTIGWLPGGMDNMGGANWPESLQRLLAARGQKQIRVVNAGVWGYSSFQGIAQFRHVLAYRPDVVLVSFGGNDPHPVALPDSQFNTALFRSPLFRLRLVQLGRSAWDRIAGNGNAPAATSFRVGLEEYRENLASMIRLCRDSGAECILLTRPFIGDSTDPLCWMSMPPSTLRQRSRLARRKTCRWWISTLPSRTSRSSSPMNRTSRRPATTWRRDRSAKRSNCSLSEHDVPGEWAVSAVLGGIRRILWAWFKPG
jgi:lysophospholipase L1-like esterase